MEPVRFPEVNTIIGKGQPEYVALPAHRGDAPLMTMTMQFRLSEEELAEVVRTRSIWIQQLTFGGAFQPIGLSVLRPPELALTQEIPGVATSCDTCDHYWGDHAASDWEPGTLTECGYPGCKCKKFVQEHP